MTKKIGLILSISLCLSLLTGCTGDNMYNNQQETILADYMAQITCQHAKGYEYRLVNVSKNPFIREEIDEGDTELNIVDEDDKNNTSQNGSSDENLTEEETSKEVTLAEAFGFDENIKVKVMKTKVTAELSKGAYLIEADEGEKLYIITLKITNEGEEEANIKYNNSKIRLVVDEKEYKPLLTALEDDISFLSKKISIDKSTEATIVFSVDDKHSKDAKLLLVETLNQNITVKLD